VDLSPEIRGGHALHLLEAAGEMEGIVESKRLGDIPDLIG
jgi:hypothetical protein